MREIIFVTTGSNYNNKTDKLFSSAESVLRLIATSSFKQLLCPYYTNILVFQCGIKSKMLSNIFAKFNFRFY